DTAAAARPTTPAIEPRARVLRPALARVAFVVGAWAALIAVAHMLIERLQAAGNNVKIEAAPLFGAFDLRLTPRVLAAVAVGALVACAGPAVAQEASFRRLLVIAVAVAAVWAIALAFVDGWQALTRPLEYHPEYLTDVPKVGSPGAFL